MELRCSKDQRRVAKLLSTKNVIVNSNPGSGKTTTVLFVAQQYKDKNILLITYSAHLKMETRQKLERCQVKNVESHSYHSFFKKNYWNQCTTDFELERGLSGGYHETLKPSYSFDIIMIDECQDMTFLYFRCIRKILLDNANRDETRLCLLGDNLQNIYTFKGSDSRFLTMGDKIFKNDLGWSKTALQMSYRLTDEIADFINICLYKNEREFPILSCKSSGKKPFYYLVDSFSSDLFCLVRDLFSTYKPGDIFILAASLRNKKSPIRNLENMLKLMCPEVAIYIPENDEESLTEKIILNKLVFATYHQSKGRERPVTVVLNFDASYTTYYNKHHKNQIECPNEMNVACSRSTETLILIHDRRHDPLPFLNVPELKKYVNIYGFNNEYNKIMKEISTSVKPCREIGASDLARFASHEFLQYFDNNVKLIYHQKEKTHVYLRPTATFNHYGTQIEESVSHLIGIAIPLIFEYRKTRNSKCYRILQKQGLLDSKKQFPNVHHFPNELSLFTIRDWLALANMWNYRLSKYYFRLYQINDYSFINYDTIEKCLYHLDQLDICNEHVIFEDSFQVSQIHDLPDIVLSCSLDCVDIFNNNIYEFKCVDKITIDHILQVAIYMFADYNRDSISTLPVKNPNKRKQWFIFNIKTSELIEVYFENTQVLKETIRRLFQDRFTKKSKMNMTDGKFLNRCSIIK